MPSETPAEIIPFADQLSSQWLTPEIFEEVKDQGFPGYISYSFMQTARTTKSVILSRLPGKVGLDLIEKGYDLKAFHIKAKSCNWGPMAGFICQLPLFNKQGIGKIGYNAKEVVHYLEGLERFSGSKKGIQALTDLRDSKIAAIAATDPKKDEKIAAIKAECDKKIVDILLKDRDKEQTDGKWSGENAIPTEYPFIGLKREFDIEKLLDIRGIKHFTHLNATTVYGVAENVTDETGANNRPSVITEFILKQDNADPKLWSIYHGRIKYKASDDPEKPFDKIFGGEVMELPKEFDADYLLTNGEHLKKIFAFEQVHKLKFDAADDLSKFRYEVGGKPIFSPPAGSQTFYVVQGFVNPFPPFPLPAKPEEGAPPPTEQDSYYKNAVSGDYDLFAIWPSMDLNQDELIRQSELTSGEYNRIGGKIFTTYIGNRNNFAIEFVPGFSELAAKPGEQKLKESAEFGNMNSHCHLVSGILNSNAAYFLKVFNEVFSDGNKGFHSDEGGRPGIMEVEFPIAVFLPKKMESAALNNTEDEGGTIIPTLDRPKKFLGGGLIKSTEELVMFILECMEANYRVLMHYRWMIHLLYDTDTPANEKIALLEAVDLHKHDIEKYDKKFKKEDCLKDFNAIDANRLITDRHMARSTALYVENLKTILKCNDDESDLFAEIKKMFYAYNFLSNMPSFDKRQELEDIMNKTLVEPAEEEAPAH